MTLNNYSKDGVTFRKTLASIPLLSPEWRTRALGRLNTLTKPLGSLGRLEEIAARLVAIREVERPQCTRKVIFTLAADHGVTDEGVSAYPKAVTSQLSISASMATSVKLKISSMRRCAAEPGTWPWSLP
jgi:NaMN:DMB phosphoribosyltransferase